VTPSGGDDTAALQCAIDTAVSSGKPATIRLGAGRFHTAQLVAKGFVGVLSGRGVDATVVTNLSTPLPVTAVDFFDAEPGPSNPWPTLLAFLDGDFTVSDLTIEALGEAPTTGWSVFGIEPPIKALAQEIVVVGTSARARFERITFAGRVAPSDQIFGMNVYNAVFFEGILGPPIAGTFDVRDSDFVEVAAGAVAVNVQDARVSIASNRSTRTPFPVQLADTNRTDLVVVGNHFDGGVAGVQVLDACGPTEPLCGLSNSRVLIAGNTLSAFDGIELLATFHGAMSCAVVGNRIQSDALHGGVDVWLGGGTTNCLVQNNGPVRDDGHGNTVIALH